MRIESSIITSLSELRAIEQQRIADERAAVERERAAEAAARRAVEQARIEAEEARVRAEREQAMRIEQARVDAEREARMRVEATEAAERARMIAAIEQQRMADELELRRAEIAKKRPTWMLAVTGVALVATIAFGFYAAAQAQESANSNAAAAAANAKKQEAVLLANKQREELDRLTLQMDELDAQVAKAQKALVDAETQADRERVAADIRKANEQKVMLRKQREAAAAAAAAAERAAGFSTDGCGGDTLGCINGQKPKKRK